MRSLEEVLAELKQAEKEYADKCQKYGIEEKHKKKKDDQAALDENVNPTIATDIDNVNAQEEAK